MAKRFWSWLKGIFRKLGRTENDLEDWYRLEFRDHKKAPPNHRERA